MGSLESYERGEEKGRIFFTFHLSADGKAEAQRNGFNSAASITMSPKALWDNITQARKNHTEDPDLPLKEQAFAETGLRFC